MALTFKQGVHPHYREELTREKPLRRAEQPEKVIIPMQQHIGAPCRPLVKKGDHVKKGQKIGDTDGFVSAPVHASVSGEVKEITQVRIPSGEKVEAVVIIPKKIEQTTEKNQENGQDRAANTVRKFDEISAEEIKKVVREAGITGMGGAMFPTHVKLSVPEEKTIDYFILNGAECEPYLTADERMMMEKTEEIISGMKLIMKAIGASKGIVALEDNKQEAVKLFEEKIKKFKNIDLKIFATKYPQGGETMLIKAALDREVPPGGLPLDVGVVVNNVMTAAAVHSAVYEGQPMINRVVCVSGEGISNPGNYLTPIGTQVKELIRQAGGFSGKPGKVIVGGPMMGQAQPDLEAPLVKGSSGIVVLPENMSRTIEPQACIRCARCVDACPVYLMPTRLMNFIKQEMYDQAEENMLNSCIECGSCAYICPSKIPLVHYFRIGKAELRARKRDNDE